MGNICLSFCLGSGGPPGDSDMQATLEQSVMLNNLRLAALE